MHSQIQLGDLSVDVVRKGIKHTHLSVHPPTGRVTIAAPSHLSLDTIRVFAIAKLPWIRKQRERFEAQEREPPREYLDRESHYVWGRRYLLKVLEGDHPASVEFSHSRLIMRVRPGWDRAKKQALLEAWYREQLRAALPPLIAKWERQMGVKVVRVFVQKMKTRWGSCNDQRRTLRVNTELAKKPVACLEYIAVHEMVHLSEPTHGARFLAMMDEFMPGWRGVRDDLNRLPTRLDRRRGMRGRAKL